VKCDESDLLWGWIGDSEDLYGRINFTKDLIKGVDLKED
jgi:hypothetical protein